MRIEILRLTGEPVAIEVNEGATVRDVFSSPESGRAIRREGSLLEADQGARVLRGAGRDQARRSH